MRKSLFTLILLGYFVSPGYPQQKELLQPKVSRAVYFDVSPPLKDMVRAASKKTDNSWKDGVVQNYFAPETGPGQQQKNARFKDLAVQDQLGSVLTDTSIVNVDGLGAGSAVPPDTYGEVGMNHYFQVVNLSFAIFNKTGSIILGPTSNSSVWNGMPNNANSGDAVVLYDEQADRWLFTQFSLPNYPAGPFLQMIAISQTPDPTGSWYRW